MMTNADSGFQKALDEMRIDYTIKKERYQAETILSDRTVIRRAKSNQKLTLNNLEQEGVREHLISSKKYEVDPYKLYIPKVFRSDPNHIDTDDLSIMSRNSYLQYEHEVCHT